MVRNRKPEIGEATVNPSKRASRPSPIPRILMRTPRYMNESIESIGNYVNYSEPTDNTVTNGTKERNEKITQTNTTGY